jgi:hypothetical protein
VRHAVAVANGTLALELALIAHGIGPGDEVVVTSRSFMASASCVSTVGARPVFADVDAVSQNITAETIAPLITPRTRAVIPVHLAGWPCDMAPIMALADNNGLVVIEDCAQAIGARIDGRPVGSFGHSATFSFCQDKIITTGGEGGAFVTNDSAVWSRAWSYKDHGKNRETATGPGTGAHFRWVHDGIGSNWRMTEMQAAIGLVQMTKLERWLGLRARNAHLYIDGLSGLDALVIHEPPSGVVHAWYKLYAFVQPEQMRSGFDRDAILAAAAAAGLRVFYGSCPEIYREKAYANERVEPRPIARRLGETSLMVEVHPTLTERTVRARASALAAIVRPMQRDGVGAA